jgi:hypothetical protein
MARPNVLMFGDAQWLEERTEAQRATYTRWLDETRGAMLAIVECGAGTGVPTVRMHSERLARRPGATLVRLNVREPDVPAGQVGLPLGAAEALRRIDSLV